MSLTNTPEIYSVLVPKLFRIMVLLAGTRTNQGENGNEKLTIKLVCVYFFLHITVLESIGIFEDRNGSRNGRDKWIY